MSFSIGQATALAVAFAAGVVASPYIRGVFGGDDNEATADQAEARKRDDTDTAVVKNDADKNGLAVDQSSTAKAMGASYPSVIFMKQGDAYRVFNTQGKSDSRYWIPGSHGGSYEFPSLDEIGPVKLISEGVYALL